MKLNHACQYIKPGKLGLVKAVYVRNGFSGIFSVTLLGIIMEA